MTSLINCSSFLWRTRDETLPDGQEHKVEETAEGSGGVSHLSPSSTNATNWVWPWISH